MWNLIVAVPDHCLSFYLVLLHEQLADFSNNGLHTSSIIDTKDCKLVSISDNVGLMRWKKSELKENKIHHHTSAELSLHVC